MNEGFQQIVPNIPPAADIFASHHLAQEFRREVEYRDDFQQYCQWYRLTAQKHQQELAKMKKDINIFGWFLR
jgi:hypothetical protein